jgi:hypothetical protein
MRTEQPFAGEENANKRSDVKTREKLAIGKIHIADSKELAAIFNLRSWRLNLDSRRGERRSQGEVRRIVATHHAAPMIS